METVCVAYSGIAASMVSSRSSISRALAFIGCSHREDHCIALDRLLHRLEYRLQKGQSAGDCDGVLVGLRTKHDARQREHDIEIATQRVKDERRRLADHPFELLITGAARPVRIDDDIHRAPRLQLRLLDDPA